MTNRVSNKISISGAGNDIDAFVDACCDIGADGQPSLTFDKLIPGKVRLLASGEFEQMNRMMHALR
jgi:hypothetical protein